MIGKLLQVSLGFRLFSLLDRWWNRCKKEMTNQNSVCKLMWGKWPVKMHMQIRRVHISRLKWYAKQFELSHYTKWFEFNWLRKFMEKKKYKEIRAKSIQCSENTQLNICLKPSAHVVLVCWVYEGENVLLIKEDDTKGNILLCIIFSICQILWVMNEYHITVTLPFLSFVLFFNKNIW